MRGINRDRGGGFRRLEEVAAKAGSLLPRHGEGRHLLALAAWRAAVGERVDRATRFATLERGVMTVEVPDSHWRDSLVRLEPQILARVRGRLGSETPSRIEFRIDAGLWRPARRVSPVAHAGEEPGIRAEPEAARREAPAAGEGATSAALAAGAAEPIAAADPLGAGAALRARLQRIGRRYVAGSPRRSAAP